MAMTRDEYLSMTEDALLKRCRVDRFRASGPGGQHRNTTDSAVRLTLDDLKISAEADEDRSQHRKRAAAVKRLRMALALEIREGSTPPWSGPWDVGQKNVRYPIFVAAILDSLDEAGYRVSDAAAGFGLSTGRLVKVLRRNPRLWAAVNRERRRLGMSVLKGK